MISSTSVLTPLCLSISVYVSTRLRVSITVSEWLLSLVAPIHHRTRAIDGLPHHPRYTVSRPRRRDLNRGPVRHAAVSRSRQLSTSVSISVLSTRRVRVRTHKLKEPGRTRPYKYSKTMRYPNTIALYVYIFVFQNSIDAACCPCLFVSISRTITDVLAYVKK